MKQPRELIEIIKNLLEQETADSLPLPDLLGLVIYYSTNAEYALKNLADYKNKIDYFLTAALGKEDKMLDSNNLRALIMIASLQQQSIADSRVADKLRQLDTYLFECSSTVEQQLTIENLYKLLQICNYMVERTNPKAKEYLDSILEKLFKNESSKGLNFWDAVIKIHRDTGKHIQFGLHEGLCGVLMMLIQLSDHNLYTNKIKEIIKNGTLFLLSYKTEADFSSEKYSIFPDSVSVKENNPVFSNKLSWNSSDLNEAVLLYNLNNIFHDPSLVNKANLIGLNTLLRRDEDSTAVHSAKIFDGAAGIAMTYYSLYLLSGHVSYKNGYHYWVNQTIQFLENELKEGVYRSKSSFTHGLTGIFYSLIVMEKRIEPFWHKALLLNHNNVEIPKIEDNNLL